MQVLRLGLAAMARSIFYDFSLILTFVKEYSDSNSHNFMWGQVILSSQTEIAINVMI